MRLEDMKNNIPETPEFIHKMVQEEVKKQMQGEKTVPIKKKRKYRTGMQVAAAAAVCLIATSTFVYAGSQLYHMYLEKQGNYSVDTGIRTEETSAVQLPEKIHDVSITTNYIPEGMEWTDEYHLQYADHKENGGFSFSSALLDDDDLDKVKNHTGIVESEERTFGKYEGVYLRYQDLTADESFDQRIYLLCPEEYRVLTIYVGDDVSKEDAVKVAENLVLTQKDTMIETAGLYTWSEEVSPEEAPGEEIVTTASADTLPVYKIADAMQVTSDGEDTDGNYVDQVPVQVKVDSVQIADDLQLLNGQIPEKWSDAVGSDGKLLDNTLNYVKSGDGVNTLDEVVKTETEKQKLVYASVTYTNLSDQEIRHIQYLGSLMLLHNTDGTYQAYDPRETSGDGYDHILWNGPASIGEMVYMNTSDNYGNGGNYIPSLKPGESTQIAMAWIVNASDLKDMYLNLTGDAASVQFTESTLSTGIVDIRQN